MLTRLHISSFVALTIGVWLFVLWLQGNPVLHLNFLKPFGIVVGAIGFVTLLFNKYFWAWRIFKGWYVRRPDLRGTWKGKLESNWCNPETNQPCSPIEIYVVVRQTLTTLSFRMLTAESTSVLVAHSIEQQEADDLFKVLGVYRNEPSIELQGKRSEIHHGAFSLDIHGNNVDSLSGHYWTDRSTRGSMKLTERNKKVCSMVEEAVALFL